MRTFVLGGGCFWCLDAVYQKTKGVSSVVSGYTGGHDRNPDYYSVCSGTTGHAEVVAVTFDEDVIPAEVILDMFFALHDPTTLNRQGYDVGTQYRSSMFYETTEEKILFEEAIERNQALWRHPIVTEVSRLPTVPCGRGNPPGLLRQVPGAGLLPGHHQPEAGQGEEILLCMA